MKTVFFLSLFLLLSATVAKSERDDESLTKFRIRFSEQKKEFSQIRGAINRPGIDLDCAKELERIADNYSIQCSLLSEELYILYVIENESDKAKVGKIVKDRIKATLKIFDLELENVTNHINFAKKTAIVVQGNKLKGDLKQLRDRLHDIAPPLHGGEGVF